LLASMIWGLHFNLIVKITKVLPRDIYTPLTLFFITSNSIWILLLFTHKPVFANINTLWQSGTQIRLYVFILIVTTLVAASLLYIAMQFSSNATLASLLDITYPVFVALVAWLVFKEGRFDWSLLLGGTLIFAGSLLIIWKHG